MLPASNRGVGTAVGTPDTCNTPTGTGVDVPTPYANTGDHSQSVGFSPTVYVSMMNALSQSATVPSTSGDESGTSHPTIKGMLSHTSGNPIVYVNSVPGVTVSSTTSHNNGNCPAGSVVSPGAANVFYTYAAGAPPALGGFAPVSSEEAATWAERVSGPTLVASREGGRLTLAPRVVTAGTASEVLSALHAYEGVARLVLDLRGCPGGTLDGAVRVASLFLPEGSEVGRVGDGDGDLEILRARPGERSALALEVLVDEDTASAAEIVALALHVHGRATVTGDPSHGKATVQTLAVREGVRAYETVGTLAGPGGARLDGRYR